VIRIDKPIVDMTVATRAPEGERATLVPPAAPAAAEDNVVRMHEKLERPEALVGTTYKIKPPVADHALYITINDIILNEGTPHETRRPFEIFINSKNLDHFQWIVALTRIISAVFRKGGDVTFLVDELQEVFDPRGGYWKPGGRFMPSLIAEIGATLERHLVEIGLMQPRGPDEAQRSLIAEKKAEYERRAREGGDPGGPRGAQLCHRCNTAAVVMLDGCRTCLNCGDSKCG